MDQDEDVYDFLRERGVQEPLIQKMKEEKINMEVINLMTDEMLEKYIPVMGDRLLLREHCKSKQKSAKKDSLFTILKKKMRSYDRKENDSDSQKSFPLKTEKAKKKHNALKPARLIQIGWIHQGETLRSQSGGGTRKVLMSKNSNNRDICEMGKKLFFMNGRSSQGEIDEFDFDVLDFQRVKMPDDVTIADVYDITKMDGVLRFYISTSKKHINITPESHVKNKSAALTKALDQSIVDLDKEDTVIIGPSHSTPTKFALADTIALSDSDVSIPSLDSGANSATSMEPLNDHFPGDIVAQAIALSGIEESRLADDNNNKPKDTWTVCLIKARRGQVFSDIITYLKGINIVDNQTFEIKMILPDGKEEAAEDDGGLLRDALSEFWETFYTTCTLGETVRVPTTLHTMQDDDWVAVSKVIYIGYKQENIFPIRLAIPFIKYCMSGDSKLKATELLPSYMEYLPEIDRTTIQSALDDFDSVDFEDLIDILSSKDVRTNPTKSNLRNIVLEVAHKELLQDPAYIADCWRPIFQKELGHIIHNDISTMYDSLNPTVRKVLAVLLFPNDMSKEQEDTKMFLQKFVKSLNPSLLEKFLRYCTGSTLLIGRKINVTFIKEMSDFSRRPVGRTCGCILELPYSYKNYIDFRKEFTSVLDSGVWVMDII